MRKWLIGLVIVIVVVALGKNVVAKAAVTGGVKAMTGLDLGIQSMDVGVLNSAVGIQGLQLHNPAGFPERIMVDLPEIYVNYDLGAFVGGKVHLEEVRLDLREFVVVKDAQGRLNLDALKVVQESKQAGKPSEKKPAANAPKIQVDLLKLKIGRVVFKDYSKGGEPSAQEFAINIDETYKDITNPQAFAALVVSRALMSTSLASLTNLNVGALPSVVSGGLGQATQAITDAAEAAKKLQGTAKETAEGAAKVGKEALGIATGGVKGVADSLKKALPFGSNEAQ